jgi:hypothetical protein
MVGIMSEKGKAAPSVPEAPQAAPADGPLIAVSLKLNPADHATLRMYAAEKRMKHQAILLEAFREYMAARGR